MEQFIQAMSNWFAQHGVVFTATTLFAGIGTTILVIFVKKVVPNLMNKFISVVVNIVAKLFGADQDTTKNKIEQLGFVKDIKQYHEDYLADKELELIKIKQRLVSGKLTETEKLAQTFIYDKIMATVGDKISEGTKLILERLKEE